MRNGQLKVFTIHRFTIINTQHSLLVILEWKLAKRKHMGHMPHGTFQAHCKVCRRRRRLGTASQHGIIYQRLLLSTEQSPSDLRNHASMYKEYTRRKPDSKMYPQMQNQMQKKATTGEDIIGFSLINRPHNMISPATYNCNLRYSCLAKQFILLTNLVR